MSTPDMQHQLTVIARSLPQSYDDLAAEVIAEEQFAGGVRRLNLHGGGPTASLRSLVDDVRHGIATVDDLDAALDALEGRLCIPRTVSGPAANTDNTPDAEGRGNARVR